MNPSPYFSRCSPLDFLSSCDSSFVCHVLQLHEVKTDTGG
jgi:hypothetical protein